MRTCRKTQSKVQLSLQPIIKNTGDPVNQSKLEADYVREARENLCERVTIDLGDDEMAPIVEHHVTDFNYVMNQLPRSGKRVGKKVKNKNLESVSKTTIPFNVVVPMPPSQWTFRDVRSGFFKGRDSEIKKKYDRDQSFSVGVLENIKLNLGEARTTVILESRFNDGHGKVF